MNLNKKIFFFFLIPFAYYLLSILNPNMRGHLVKEDGVVESIGAIAFLLTSILFFYLFFQSKKNSNIFFGRKTNYNIYFCLLGILFFIGFGEEISWGQRIFGWATPESFGELNAQNETNLHNIWIFQGYNPDGSNKTFMELLLTPARLFSLFWLAFCVLVPLLSRFSEKAKSIITFLGIPLVPLWIGGLFLINYFAVQIIEVNFLNTFDNNVSILTEIKESVYALIFLVVASYFASTAYSKGVHKSPLAVQKSFSL